MRCIQPSCPLVVKGRKQQISGVLPNSRSLQQILMMIQIMMLQCKFQIICRLICLIWFHLGILDECRIGMVILLRPRQFRLIRVVVGKIWKKFSGLYLDSKISTFVQGFYLGRFYLESLRITNFFLFKGNIFCLLTITQFFQKRRIFKKCKIKV